VTKIHFADGSKASGERTVWNGHYPAPGHVLPLHSLQTPFGLESIVPATGMYTPGQTVLKCNDSKYLIVL